MRWLALVLLLLPASSRADASPPAPKPPAAQPPKRDRQVDARERFRRGTTLYNVGRFDEAIQEFQAAYLLVPEPAILFDLGQCQRVGGHPDEALRTFRRFLALKPAAPNRADVEQKIAELEAQVRARDGGAPR